MQLAGLGLAGLRRIPVEPEYRPSVPLGGEHLRHSLLDPCVDGHAILLSGDCDLVMEGGAKL